MSPLTKLFVVLLVLVSVALSAGTITFVNKLDPLQRQLANKTLELQTKDAAFNKAKDDVAAAVADKTKAAQDAAAEKAGLLKDQLAGQATIEDRDAQIAKRDSQIAALTSANASQSTALAASEDSKGKLSDQVVALRKDADDRLRMNADLGQRVSSLTANLEQTERARRALAEQLTDANTRASQAAAKLRDIGVPESQFSTGGTGAGAPALNGIIRSRRNIAGKEYATISIGSSDLVTKGMQFKIIDKDNGTFLGLLQVEVVDQNEAMGQITAEPQNLAQIKAGNVVRTQI